MGINFVINSLLKKSFILNFEMAVMVRQICEKLFPFGLQVPKLVLLKIRALEIVVDVEPRENLQFFAMYVLSISKNEKAKFYNIYLCVCVCVCSVPL